MGQGVPHIHVPTEGTYEEHWVVVVVEVEVADLVRDQGLFKELSLALI